MGTDEFCFLVVNRSNLIGYIYFALTVRPYFRVLPMSQNNLAFLPIV